MGLIDLHTHSNLSDGTDPPGRVVRLAAKAGLTAVALTDHDTTAGVAEALEAGRGLALEVVPGVEVGVEVGAPKAAHLAGLWVDPADSGLAEMLAWAAESRRERNRAVVARLAELGHALDLEDLEDRAGGLVGRPHLARALMETGAARTLDEAFNRYLAAGAPAFVPRDRLDPARAVAAIRGAGGVPVLAHPTTLKLTWEALDGLLARLAGLGLAGVEAYYGEADWPRQQRLITLAAKHGLAVSGGSDYHGGIKPGLSLGFGSGTLRVPDSLLAGLKVRRSRGPVGAADFKPGD